MISNPFTGAGYLMQGVRLVFSPGLRVFVAVPLLLSATLLGGGMWWGYQQLERLTAWLLGFLPGWLSWLEWLLDPLFMITGLLVGLFSFTLVANLIGAPFNALLAEKVEERLSGALPPQAGGWKRVALEALPAMLDELGKVLYFILRAIPLLILFVIPGLNVAAPFLWLLFTAWMMAVEYGDFPMGNHNLKGKEMRARLGSRRVMSLGFGGLTLLLTAIPVVNFIVMPAAVAGATAMWVGELKGRG